MSAHVVHSALGRLCAAVLLGSLALTPTLWAQSRPVILEATPTLVSPDPNYRLGSPALSGNNLLVLAYRPSYDPEEDQDVLFHYERQSDGTWSFAGRVAGTSDAEGVPVHLAFEGNIAAFGIGRGNLFILERTACCWVTTPVTLPGQFASDVEINGDTVAVGASDFTSYVSLLRKNAAGEWIVTAELAGAPPMESSSFVGPEVGFAGSTVSAANRYGLDHNLEATHVFDFLEGAWRRTAQFNEVYHGVPIGNELTLRDYSVSPGEVVRLIRRDTSGAWNLRTSLRSEETSLQDEGLWASGLIGSVVFEDGLAYVRAPPDDLRGENSGSLAIFAPSGRDFVHRATLVASDATPGALFGRASVDGRRVAVAGATTDPSTGQRTGGIYLFDLPASLPLPTRVQDDFQDVNAAGWTPWGTTNWRVLSSDGSYVYRQTNVQGGARSILDAPSTANQSIEADVKVTSFGSTSWVGLMVRYTDPLNFYYITAGLNNTIQIRRMVNGEFGPIASAPFTPVRNHNYRLRLEAVGTWLRAYVDGTLVAQVRDTALTQGRAGLTMWKTAADFDNVIVSTSPNTVLHQDTFAQTSDEQSAPWTTSPSPAWRHATTVGGATVFRQTSSTVETARAINGAPAADQIISAELRPQVFNASGTGRAGLIARYINDRNYYYVMLGDNNRVSLRKVSNGAVTVLEEVPFTINVGTSYRVRLEAIGSALRLYINGRLLAEGRDSQFSTGRYGLITYRAAADFDSFVARRP